MKLTTKVRYGLRILQQIAEDNARGELARGRLISEEQEIPKNYMEQILIPLKKHGLIVTERGIKGGYRLSRRPETITVREIIEILEGKIQLVKCKTKNFVCKRFDSCPARKIWENLSLALREKAENITLRSMLAEE